MEVYDLVGRQVHKADFKLEGDEITVIQWSGEGVQGDRVSPGMYVYKITTGLGGYSKTIQGRIIIR